MGRRAGKRGARICLALVVFLVLPALGALGLPDLLITDPALIPASVDQGDEALVRATISAVGLVEGESVIVRLSWRRVDLQDGCCHTEYAITPQQARLGYSLEVPIDTSSQEPGSYAITIVVDPENLISEEDETNNQAILHLEILALKPELHPQELVLNPPSPVEWGQAIAITTTIENSGHSTAGGFGVQFFLFPAFCVTDTGETYRISATVLAEGTGEAARGEWLFEQLEAGHGTDVEEWFEAVGDALDERTWIPFWSARVSGLEVDDSVDLTGVLPTGQGLRDILAAAGPGLPGSIMEPLEDSALQMGLLEHSATVYVISAVVDPAVREEREGAEDTRGEVREEDESNNRITGALSVRPSKLGLPELQPIRLFLKGPLPLEWGDNQDATAFVTNTGGSAVAEDTVGVLFQYRRVGAGSTDWEDLESVLITSELGVEEGTNTREAESAVDVDELELEPGNYELRVIVDPPSALEPNGAVDEENEENNELVIGFSVEGAEIHPIGILVGSEEVRQGDTIPLSAPVRNTGDRTLKSFVVGFFLDDVRFDTFYYYDASSGSDREGLEEKDIAWAQGLLETEDLPPGEYELRVIVDPDGAIPEMDENNNEITRTLRILPRTPRRPELVPMSLVLSPDSPLLVPQDVEVQITVWNRGSLDASSFLVELQLREEGAHGWIRVGGDNAKVLVQGLPRGTKATLELSLEEHDLVVEGRYWLRAVVDAADQVEELDEENNLLAIALHVGAPQDDDIPPTPYPNLVFEMLRVTPTQDVDAREQITIQEAVVRNAGQEAAGAFDVTLCWKLNDGPCVPTGIVVAVPGLGGETETDLAEQFGTVEAPATPGLYQLIGMADALYEVDERGREADNKATASAHVTGMVKPDLTIDEIRFSVNPPLEVGSSVTAFARVRNLSKEVGASAFDVRIEQLDAGPVRDFSVSRLGPGATLDLSFGLSTSSLGDFVLRVVADVDDSVTETDDDNLVNNNTLEEPFSVVAALPVPVEQVAVLGGDARYLVADEGSDVLYAASSNGRVVALLQGEPAVTLFDVSLGGGEVVALGLVPGVALYVAVAASPDVIHVLNPATGESEDEITLFESMSVTCMTAATDGTVYVGTSKGMLAIDPQGNLVTGSGSTESVVAITVDSSANLVYVISASTFYSLTGSLEPRCALPGFQGTLTSLAVGPSAIYVGTEEGNLFAYAPCNGNGLVRLWQYPQIGSLGSAIAAVVVDPSDFDPIYVAVKDGRLFALDSLGQEMWSYTVSTEFPQDGFAPAPVWDARTGRVFIVDTGGTPYVLDSRGIEVFAIDASASSGTTVGSSLVIDEYTIGTGSIERLVRVYYYGGNDGAVYMIRTER